MGRLLTKLFNIRAPIRKGLVSLIKRLGFGSYTFRVSIGAVDRPHYAHILFNAARLASCLGHPRISVLEYGVAGGRGLLALERHAAEVEKHFGVGIDIYGFDTGEGLPAPLDYRDVAFHWQAGFFRMDVPKLKARLRSARLVLGNIKCTSQDFFARYEPAPIGAIVHDMDFYSSTADAFSMLHASEKYYLPRVFCYFDDIIGSELVLYSEFTGERLAIREFNDLHNDIKFDRAYYFLAHKRPETWHQQIRICHFFKHSQYNTFISRKDQQIGI